MAAENEGGREEIVPKGEWRRSMGGGGRWVAGHKREAGSDAGVVRRGPAQALW